MIQMLELRYAIRAPEAVLKHTWQHALPKPVLAERDTIWAATTHLSQEPTGQERFTRPPGSTCTPSWRWYPEASSLSLDKYYWLVNTELHRNVMGESIHWAFGRLTMLLNNLQRRGCNSHPISSHHCHLLFVYRLWSFSEKSNFHKWGF